MSTSNENRKGLVFYDAKLKAYFKKGYMPFKGVVCFNNNFVSLGEAKEYIQEHFEKIAKEKNWDDFKEIEIQDMRKIKTDFYIFVPNPQADDQP